MSALSPTTSSLTVDGLEVRMLRAGPGVPTDAPPVLVLHGWGASIDALGSIVAGLGETLDVVALDLPGFGSSAPPPEAWDVPAYATFVLAFADEIGLKRFSLVGHSFGARIGIVIAERAPERLARLVLTGAAGIKPRRKPSYYGRVAIAKAGRLIGWAGGRRGRRLQDRMRQRVGSRDWLDASEAMRGTFRLVVGEDLTPRLRSISASTLLLWGQEDLETPMWMGQRMEQQIPDAALVALPGGHYVYAERAGEFNRIAQHFLVDAA